MLIDSLLQTNLEAIQEDLTTSLDNKNPSIRSETALFMARCFAKTNPNLVSKKLLKTFVTSLLKVKLGSDCFDDRDCECDFQRSLAEFGVKYRWK